MALAQRPADWDQYQGYRYPGSGYPQTGGPGPGSDTRPPSDEPSFDFAGQGAGDSWDTPPRGRYPSGYGGRNPFGDGGPSGGRAPYPDISGSQGVRPSGPPGGGWQAGDGFRFRGDKEIPEGRWHELPMAPGYRFRPMSPEELERSTGGDGWRPIRPDERAATKRRAVAPPDTDAFESPSDSWFRKYYGDRP